VYGTCCKWWGVQWTDWTFCSDQDQRMLTISLKQPLKDACNLVLQSVPLWLIKRTVLVRINICSFEGLLLSFILSLCVHSSSCVCVESPSLILLFDYSHFQGCCSHTVLFPLLSPCSSSFCRFIYQSSLICRISFFHCILNCLFRATDHHSFSHLCKHSK
jgi:hypothetical protein